MVTGGGCTGSGGARQKAQVTPSGKHWLFSGAVALGPVQGLCPEWLPKVCPKVSE